ncbi:hypothetical protein R1flu_009652 [Riccia fluitans]|uniref:Uncharacterized protein n=1 Tax=Riccia fluitans TaxID=41844 RepID=A0ABD1Z3H6_9MARC
MAGLSVKLGAAFNLLDANPFTPFPRRFSVFLFVEPDGRVVRNGLLYTGGSKRLLLPPQTGCGAAKPKVRSDNFGGRPAPSSAKRRDNVSNTVVANVSFTYDSCREKGTPPNENMDT